MQDLIARATNGKLSAADLQGGSLSVSSVDVDGLIEVVQPPQVAALAVGKGRREVVADDSGLPTVATVCDVTLSCDQRVIDEEIGGKFLSSFRKYLSQPHFL